MVYGRGKFIKVGMLTPLDFVPRGGRDMAVKAEGCVEVAPWWVLSRRLNFFFLHVSDSLDSDDELLELLSEDEDRLWHCFSLFAFLVRL